MVNNNKNSKQTESKQKSWFKNASDQQENQPKKGKIMKPDHNENILMSKQLMQKRSSSRTRRLKRKTTSTYRFFPNAKPMPSLADLEKMFEDSDDDVEDHKSTDANQQPAPKCSAQISSNITETLMIPKVMVTDVLLSPTQSNRIEEQVKVKFKKSSSSIHSNIEITSPSRKRIKSHEQSDDSDDLPSVNISPRKEKNTNSVTVENILCQNKTKHSMISVEPEGKTEKLIHDAVINNSSNKLQSTCTLEAFSPIPSTSQYNQVLENNNNLAKDQLLKQQIPKTHIATIVIEDEPMEHPATNVKTEINDNIQIIDTTNQITSTEAVETSNRQDSCEDDDDCIIVESSINTINNSIREPNIIDIEVINTETERSSNSTEQVHNEIIDVDSLIAHNQSIFNKYNATKPLNLLIDVDLSSIEENRNNQRHTRNNFKPQLNETPEQVTISINMQGQPSNDHNLEHIRIDNTRNDSNIHSQPSTERQINDSISVKNIRMGEEYYRNLTAIQRIHDSHVLSPSELFSPYPIITASPLMAKRNSPGGQQSVHRHRLPTSSSSDRTQYPTSSSDKTQHPTSSSDRTQYSTSSSSDRTQYPTSSLSDGTQYPTSSSLDRTQYPTSSLRVQYNASVASIAKRSCAQKMRMNAQNTSVSKDHPSTSGDAVECHSNSIHSLGDCPICMEKLSGKGIGSTICGHVFCMSCLQRAVKTNKRCPTCRKMLKCNGYHKLFL
ncbi:unnamed protein product [Arctia plantaginis]|uniref:RING-type domain-containing protein n=1 Tax=Arctia plantaginis TaxID=874455 RepID=A0A8S1BDV5_ARCPL|nr:unnamed protein product [Arctia plantaginis]